MVYDIGFDYGNLVFLVELVRLVIWECCVNEVEVWKRVISIVMLVGYVV